MADIQEKVEALIARVGDALQGLLTLEVQTAVTKMTIKPDGNDWSLEPVTDVNAEGVTTRIRLEQGDIQNALSEGALQNDKLMEMHTQQVALSRQIVADNIQALVTLANSLASSVR